MRPFTVLLGILMGSSVSLAFCLLLVWVVILLLPQSEQVFGPETGTLLKAIGVFTAFAVTSSASFAGEIRQDARRGRPGQAPAAGSPDRWRYWAHLGTAAMVAVTVLIYWPR